MVIKKPKETRIFQNSLLDQPGMRGESHGNGSFSGYRSDHAVAFSLRFSHPGEGYSASRSVGGRRQWGAKGPEGLLCILGWSLGSGLTFHRESDSSSVTY